MKSESQMKSVLVHWTMSAAIAICLTPGLRGFTPRHARPQQAMLAQDDAPVAVPGSADAAPPAVDDDGDSQAGQAQGPSQDDPDTGQPPSSMQQPPDNDGGDTSAEPQSGDDNGNQGDTPVSPSTGSEEN